MAERITFPRDLIKRTPEQDFSDDGTRFFVYKYKDSVRFTKASYKDEVYISIHTPYIYGLYDPAHAVIDEFNGVHKSRFDLDRFLANLEKVYKAYYIPNEARDTLLESYAVRRAELNEVIRKAQKEMREMEMQVKRLYA